MVSTHSEIEQDELPSDLSISRTSSDSPDIRDSRVKYRF